MVHSGDLFVAGGGIRAAGNHRHAPPIAALYHSIQRVPLNDHRRDKHHIRPRQVILRQRGDVGINQPVGILVAHDRRHGYQTKRRHDRLFPDEGKGVAVTPIRIGDSGVDQEDFPGGSG
jgi:hypothetical protein